MKNGLSEIRLFLKKHLLEFHEIWYKNTLENNWLEYWKKIEL